MVKRALLGLFTDANYAAEAGEALQGAGLSNEEFDFLTGTPYPEGAFGERHISHRLYIFPLVGALLGMTAGILLTSMTQVAYPMVTGGKPILSLPAMAIPTYEGTLLGGRHLYRFGHHLRVAVTPVAAGSVRRPHYRGLHRAAGDL